MLKVTEESVHALRNLDTQITECHKALLENSRNLISVYEENKGGLGYHSDELRKLIENLMLLTDNAGKPIRRLSRRLKTSADIRQKHIENSLGHLPQESTSAQTNLSKKFHTRG